MIDPIEDDELRDMPGGKELLLDWTKDKEIESLRQQLAASQAREKELRERVELCLSILPMNEQIDELVLKDCTDYLALPFDSSALDKLLAEERERCAKVCESVSGNEPSGADGRFGALDSADAIRELKP